MGVVSAAEYESAFRKLFPQGEYWDNQFADTESDVTLFCKAKLPEFIKFRQRMKVLQTESIIETTTECIAEWERVLLGYINVGIDINERRLLLKSKRDIKLNRTELQKIADLYGFTITNIEFQYRPAFFGHSHFTHDYIGSLSVFSAFVITVAKQNLKQDIWPLIEAQYFDKSFGHIRCGVDTIVYMPFANGADINNQENLMINYYMKTNHVFLDFEKAINEKLIANQICYFIYSEGE
jgi:uncharacterized protein YmfQ (DUF2313 family)